MKNKPSDILYCGVDRNKILHAKPILDEYVLVLLKEFITDRYKIHIEKDVLKNPAPWTKNGILQLVKFTNVRREHDRQSRFYIDKIASNKNVDWFNKFWNTVMFRMFNVSTLWDGIKRDFIDIRNIPKELDFYRSEIKKIESQGVILFTNAFNTGGLKQSLAVPEFNFNKDEKIKVHMGGGYYEDFNAIREHLISGKMQSNDFEPSMPMRVIRYVSNSANFLLNDLHEKILKANSQQEAYEMLLKIRGFSRFLAYQVFVDLTYCEEFPFSENEFTISGPGCDAGINLLFKDKNGMTSEECLFWLRDNDVEVFGDKFFYDLFSDLEEHDRYINVMSLENLHCELSKYVRNHAQVSAGEKPRGRVSTAKLASLEKTIRSIPEFSTKKLW